MILTPSINLIRGWFDSGATFTEVGQVRINTNDDFFYNTSGLISGGNGSEENPWIIENVKIQPDDTDGIVIQDTNDHFILRNCWVWDVESMNWDNHHGIYLINVTNGRIEDCKVTPDPIAVPSPSEPAFVPSWCAIRLQGCTNCTLERNLIMQRFVEQIAHVAEDNQSPLVL
ncbi:MAG: hypothetical protein ACFFCS_22145, partial [Candidatus Hodarchaeota archaeon]